GEHRDLERATQEAFGQVASVIEAEWKAYLALVPRPQPPAVAELFPADHAEHVSPAVEEIWVRFNAPMRRGNFSVIANCDRGVCYKNAYWKSATVFAIKLPQKLKRAFAYHIRLGTDAHPFESAAGLSAPVLEWAFTTD